MPKDGMHDGRAKVFADMLCLKSFIADNGTKFEA